MIRNGLACLALVLATVSPAKAQGFTVPKTVLLTVTWEPQFCLEHPDRAECARVTVRSPEGHQLSLQGLLSQPVSRVYCGISDRTMIIADQRGDWNALPDPKLNEGTRASLENWMPGVTSGLERHEWIKHGTCFGSSADDYFKRALALTEKLNSSRVGMLMENSIGRFLSVNDIRRQFDESFGPGAGLRVTVVCSHGSTPQIAQLVVALANIGEPNQMGDLIRAATPLKPGCSGGRVVPPR